MSLTGDAMFTIAQKYTCTWETHIDNIPRESWDSCFEPGDASNCYDLFAALYHAQLAETEFHYLIGSDGGDIAFVIPCYQYRAALDVLAPPMVRRICSAARKVRGSFLMLRTFVIGSPLAICRDSLGIRRLGDDDQRSVINALREKLIQKANALRCQMVVLKEILSGDLNRLQEGFAPDFFFFPSMPGSILRLDNARPYESRLRSSYRSHRKHRMAQSDAAEMKWSVTDEFAEHADEMCKLYMQVLERSSTQFEVLNAKFFREVSKRLGNRASALFGRKGERILACALLLHSESWLSPIYIGLDYQNRDNYALYFNIFYRSIDTAESRGAAYVSLGQTAYDSKAQLGSEFSELYVALAPLTMLSRFVLRTFGNQLFPAITVPRRNVFKAAEA